MSETLLLTAVRVAGALHFFTLAIAWFTPIPPGWEENLARLPEVHRRFAIAQNLFIGATLVFLGIVSLWFAPVLLAGSAGGRILATATALWWGGRLLVLPWLRVWPALGGSLLRLGFFALHLECALLAIAYAWLALR